MDGLLARWNEKLVFSRLAFFVKNEMASRGKPSHAKRLRKLGKRRDTLWRQRVSERIIRHRNRAQLR